ncbi:hypothetical protein FG87_31200 [Nocardia vulneris]|uniref:NadR/Ttd14 AAA domain-containing protein n=1 Tax=Nocardia vulneris TaxID=1141657 RepID=A0ABR4Z7U1_9NOCA|nr:hypothetical protein FG87_31200 [Nocardia vulneris]
MRGCVIAGVWGAGKTSVYQRILAHLVDADCQSVLAVPQAATITTHTYMDASVPSKADGILSWLRELTTFLEDADRRFRSSTLPDHRFAHQWTPTAVLECLAFDVPVYRLPIDRAELLDHEQRLTDLGLHLIVLRVPEPQIQLQCIESTRQYRSPKWARYLEEFGKTDALRAEYVCHAQRRLMSWVATSPLPCTVIDTTDSDWEAYATHATKVILD